MSAAAIVTGNTIAFSNHSSDSLMMGWLTMRSWKKPDFLPGQYEFPYCAGRRSGRLSCLRTITRFISFTGSKQVGLRVAQNAATPRDGQKWIKRVVAEMGGKDAIVVAKDADLDSAADGIVTSAYGFQGQKCPAAARAMTEQSVLSKDGRKNCRARQGIGNWRPHEEYMHRTGRE